MVLKLPFSFVFIRLPFVRPIFLPPFILKVIILVFFRLYKTIIDSSLHLCLPFTSDEIFMYPSFRAKSNKNYCKQFVLTVALSNTRYQTQFIKYSPSFNSQIHLVSSPFFGQCNRLNSTMKQKKEKKKPCLENDSGSPMEEDDFKSKTWFSLFWKIELINEKINELTDCI